VLDVGRASTGVGPRLPRWIAIVGVTAAWFVAVMAAPSLAARAAWLLAATVAFVPLAWRLVGDDLPAWRAFLFRSSAR
jgi:hypothetical protein